MRKINLLHLKTSATIGGAEMMLQSWGKYLDKNKFQQIIIFAESGPLISIMQDFGLRVYCFQELDSLWGFCKIPALVEFINRNKIDIIHAHGARVNLWGSIAALIANVPIISTEHNIDLWRNWNHYYNWADKLAARINQVRIGVSPAVCEMLRNEGIKPEKIKCIENGIDLEKFERTSNNSTIKAELHIENHVKVVGTVGRLVEQKGHKYFLAAAARVIKEFPEVKFLVVGDGPLKEILHQQAIELGIKGKVIFTGYRNDIPGLMAIMDLFVLPSLTEGLPLVILEAMAAKKAILATRVSGIPYIINDGVDGLLVTPQCVDELATNICYLLKNPDIAKNMASAANEKVYVKYDAKNMILQYENLYEQILK